jgi:hypothetical protein
VFESEEQCQDKKEINIYYTYREIQAYVALSFKIVVLLTYDRGKYTNLPKIQTSW